MNHIERTTYYQSCHHVFALQASHHFNKRMKGFLNDMARDMAHVFGDNLLCLVMGGTYGRGEGHVRRGKPCAGAGLWSGGEAPEDDLDLLVLLKAPAYNQAAFQRVCNKYRDISGMELDVLGVLTPSQLRRIVPDYHWHELSCHHKVLWGDAAVAREILSCLALGKKQQEEQFLSLAHAQNKLYSPFASDLNDEFEVLGAMPKAPPELAETRAILLSEAFRLIGECICLGLDTLVRMSGSMESGNARLACRRLEKGFARVGSAVLLAGGHVPETLEADSLHLSAMEADLDTASVPVFRFMADSCVSARQKNMLPDYREYREDELIKSWNAYFSVLIWGAGFLESRAREEGCQEVVAQWTGRPDWRELKHMASDVVRLSSCMEPMQLDRIARNLAGIAVNYVSL